MRGITVVGCDPDSGEIPVAVAACLAARAAGERADPFVTAAIGPNGEADAGLVAELEGVPFVGHRERASPLIAAHHTGQAFEPTELVEAARIVGAERLLIAAAPGGLLAPLTEHYSNRDFARELGLPVVVAASAVGGVTGQVRLVAEAARTAGLRVAAVVLTGWPDPPSRIQLDERGLLTKVVRAGVLTLPASARTSSALAEAAARWPVAEWTTVDAAATPAAAEPEPEPAAPLVLDPYDAWTQHEVGDPRNTQRPQIMQTMLEIVAAEGPMTATRAYSLYNRAAGGRKLTSVAKAPLSSAVYWLAREGKLTLTREADIPWQGDDMIRLPDQPAVRIRELGPRTLDEVPLEEVAALVKLIRAQRGNLDVTEMKRAILTAYGLVRLTSRADEYLGLAIDLAS